MRRVLALAVIVPWIAACGSQQPSGVLTGEIRFVGGLAPQGGIGPKAGRVIVYTKPGHVTARQAVDQASHLHYRLVLPAGEYEVNAGTLPRYDYPLNCRPQHAQVRPGQATRVNVYEGCGIQ